MTDLAFIAIDESEMRTLESWFDDAELRRRYCRPSREWFDYVRNEPAVHAWMIHENEMPVGHFQLETISDGTGGIGLVVKPDLRNRGYGKRILRAFLARGEARRLERIVGKAEADNEACHRCVKAVGFAQQGHEADDEGYLTFAHTSVGTAR